MRKESLDNVVDSARERLAKGREAFDMLKKLNEPVIRSRQEGYLINYIDELNDQLDTRSHELEVLKELNSVLESKVILYDQLNKQHTGFVALCKSKIKSLKES